MLDPAFLRPAEVDLLVGDPGKAKTKLGWEPTVDFEALVRMTERVDAGDSEFVVVPPGGEITTEMFMRPGEGAPQPMGRGES